MKRLSVVVPVALVITLILLFKAFDSFSLAVLTLLNVPFALLGGIVGLFVAGMPMSVAAAVGLHRAHRAGVAERRARAVRHRRAARPRTNACGRQSSPAASSACGRC